MRCSILGPYLRLKSRSSNSRSSRQFRAIPERPRTSQKRRPPLEKTAFPEPALYFLYLQTTN
ncbi:hypothetical protein TcasGA2_TC008376 [Tribolium castaneum]|uniref:Uncharacterized protein n=1 Tax=Tribolium castaneum TaxID=7070 RepID=D2A1D6_TRICA|nr:hypothetical protein TcasGA2_TC008376 [Tribolium castaneum]